MKTKATVALGLKVFALTIILFLCYSVANTVMGIVLPIPTAELASYFVQSIDPADAALSLLVVCACHAAVLSYLIVRSRWTGWRLVLTIFLVQYSVTTFLSAIEAVVFLKYLVDIMPAAMIPHQFAHGAVVAALFSPVAVLIHGKMKGARDTQEHMPDMGWMAWIGRLLAIGVIYVVVYFLFGLLVFMPLVGDAFQSYYGNLQTPAWMPLLQVARGIIWAILALPVVRMMKGRRWESNLAVALLFSVLMGFLLLMPNPIMPEKIRRAHFVEVTSSNFLFGWIVAWVLQRRHVSIRNLLRRPGHPSKREATL
jgi:hypothetical protein